MTGWAALQARIVRGQRQLRIARRMLRLLRFDEVEVLPIGEYSVAFGYVTLWNDVAPVVKIARNVIDETQSLDDLRAALGRFDETRS